MLVNQEDIKKDDHYEMVGRAKNNKRNIWHWTHSKRVCQSLFGCDWKQLDLIWLEQCKDSFKTIPTIDIKRLSEVEESEAVRVSRFLCIPRGEHFVISEIFSSLLIINECSTVPGLRASARALMKLKTFEGMPNRRELTEYLSEDAFYTLYKVGLLRKVQLFGHAEHRNAYYYCPTILENGDQ